MSYKWCIDCNLSKPVSEFYPSYLKKGYYICKPCVKERNKIWREANLDYAREYGRNYMRVHPEINRKNGYKWRQRHLKEARLRRLEYARKNKMQHNAGELARQHYPVREYCIVDGCNNLGERHHESYMKPYEIMWLCRQHHKALHRKFEPLVTY